MKNLEQAEELFINYTKQFDLENIRLKQKKQHSLRVRDISKKIAENLKLEEKDIQLATLIGLLHDIGRFEQFTRYGTFRDRESIDHGDLGVEILKKDNYIGEYVESEDDINIICLAIKNHNKYQIETGLNDRENQFCKIIRDADKIDIFYEASEIFYTENETEEINQSVINNEIISKIYEKELIDRNNLKEKGKLTQVLVMLAFLFDMNYVASYEIIYQEDYINKIFQRFYFKDEHTNMEMQKIQKFLKEYIKDKMQSL